MRAHFVNDPQFLHSDDPAKVEHAALHARIAELEAKVAEMSVPSFPEAPPADAPPEAPAEAPIVG